MFPSLFLLYPGIGSVRPNYMFALGPFAHRVRSPWVRSPYFITMSYGLLFYNAGRISSSLPNPGDRTQCYKNINEIVGF